MHTGSMSELDGKFNEWFESNGGVCPNCGSRDVKYRSWESSCGGYEDYKYKCSNCGEIWWVDGPDS